MNPLQSLPSYEQYVYALPQQTEAILRSTLVVVRRGATIAVLNGELEFTNGLRLIVREKLSFSLHPGQIKGYGYEVWQGNELLYWYDFSRTRMNLLWRALIPTTNTCRLTSSTTACPRPIWSLMRQTSRS